MGGSKVKARVKTKAKPARVSAAKKPKTKAKAHALPKPIPKKAVPKKKPALKKAPKAKAKKLFISGKKKTSAKIATKKQAMEVKGKLKPAKIREFTIKLEKAPATKRQKREEAEPFETLATLEKRRTSLEVEIVPAILAKTSQEFQFKMYSVLPYTKRIQIDIMDGKFVPNVTVGENEKVPLKDSLVVEYHLMVQNPTDYIKLIDNPDALYIVHVEAEEKVGDVVEFCKSEGYRVGLAINPYTKADVLDKFVADIEMVLFMTVVPGFSGQAYIASVEQKIAEFKKKHPKTPVEVDGGISEENITGARAAGANLLVAASAVFSQADIKAAIESLHEKATLKKD